MRYISFEFEGEKFWIELDAEGFALRQIIVDAENHVQVSCLKDSLAEGKFELYQDGRCGYADKYVEYNGTMLSKNPLPSIEEIALDEQFKPVYNKKRRI